MKVNPGKSKFMVVNFTQNYQLNTWLMLDGKLIENVRETRLLGVTISDDLTWHANTELITKQAYKRMILLQRLYSFQLPIEEMVEIYTLYIRSILESSAVVWHSSITQMEQNELERVQKVALKIILQSEYESYENALNLTGLDTLHQRRNVLCKKFAQSCLKNEKTRSMFPLNPSSLNSRNHETFYVQPATTSRLKDSAIPFMQRLLNEWSFWFDFNLCQQIAMFVYSELLSLYHCFWNKPLSLSLSYWPYLSNHIILTIS